jgi:hypothetical protein
MATSHSSFSPVDFSATIYGSVVNCILEMTEDVELANSRLVALGYRIGRRLGHTLASDLNERPITSPSDLIMLLIENWVGVFGTSTISGYATDPNSFIINFRSTPFTQHVDIPESLSSLKYTSALPGVIRGIFEVFHYNTTVTLADSDGSKTIISVHVDGIIPVALSDDG